LSLVLTGLWEEVMIDKDRVVGSAKVVTGKVKETVGKVVGDPKLEAQGKADKIEGPKERGFLEDRVAADGEMVGQVLNPNRTPETVQFPDPAVPGQSADDSASPDSVAEFAMARRTDAGRANPGAVHVVSKRTMLLLLGGAALMIVLIVALAWM
jgi:uncharacterized protein YjbJ (UPF0337 family)